VRRKDKEVTSPAWIEDVLKRAEWLELGLAGADGWPYVVPLNFGYTDNTVIFHGAKLGKKADMLRENPKVCFQVVVDAEVVRNEENPAAFSMKYKSVTGFGIASVIEDTAEKRSALKTLMRHYDGPLEPMPDGVVEETLVAKIEISEITGKVSNYPGPEGQNV